MSAQGTTKPVVSVIVPIYNTEKYLVSCLESLHAQTLREVEFICIDDGSTDRSGEILAEYAQRDSRFRVIKQSNSGVATARNRGLAEARGTYLMFCDSDDQYEPDMCEQMYRTIEQHHVDFVMCNTFVDLADRVQRISRHVLFPFKEGRYVCRDRMRLKLNGTLWNKIFRNDIVKQYGISFPDAGTGDDDAFCRAYYFVSNTVYFLNHKLYHYVIRTGSITDCYFKRTNYKLLVSPEKAAEYVYVFLKRNMILKKHEATFFAYYLKFSTGVWMSLPVKYYQNFLEEIRLFVLENQMTHWHSQRGNKLQKALQNRDDITAAKILGKMPNPLMHMVLSCKYFILAKIPFINKRKHYHKKLVRLLYYPRNLKRWKE